jgi:hypothetical protein
MESSVGSVGDSYDNALAETIIGLYKTEVIRRNGRWRNIEGVEFATLDWVDWFNNRRLFGPIGNVPSAEFEAVYYGNNAAPALMAGLTQRDLRKNRYGSVITRGQSVITVFGTRPIASCFLAFSWMLALNTAVRGHEESSPVIVDTDMALDDVRALALILSSDRARVKVMVTSDGSSSAKAGYHSLLRVLDFLEIREFSAGMGEVSNAPRLSGEDGQRPLAGRICL